MIKTKPAVALFLWLATAAACSGRGGSGLPSTALMLEVDTALRSPAVNGIRVDVSGNGVKPWSEMVLAVNAALPFRRLLEPEGASTGPAIVDVTGLRGDAEVIRRRVVVYFLKGEVRLLRIELEETCIGKACDGGKTCGAGGECVDPGVDVNTLPPYQPEKEPKDAAPADGPPADTVEPDLPPVAPFEVELDGVTAKDFTGPAGDGADMRPRLVYPLDHTMVPRNQPAMKVQFFGGLGNKRYRITFRSTLVDARIYFGGGACEGAYCQWDVPTDVWRQIAEALAGRPVEVRIAGTAASGMPVAESEPFTLEASPEPVIGGLYYFSTSLPGIVRVPLVAATMGQKATPFITPSTAANPKDCVGCHALSRDGLLFAGTYGHGDDFLGVTSGANPEDFVLKPGTTRTNFQTFNADGSKLVSNFNGQLIVRDTITGAELGRVPQATLGGRAIEPQWSNDGATLVVTRLLPESDLFYDVATCCGKREGGDWLATDAGDIVTLGWDGATFVDPEVVVAAAPPEYHYYPAWSPDDQWIVFNTGTKPGYSPIAQDTMSGFSYGVPADRLVTYEQKTSRLRLVSRKGGTPVELERASMGGDAYTSLPTFAMFQQDGSRLAFITFSSHAAYGYAKDGGDKGLPQLWMAAVDLGKAASGAGDPSWSPVWLPFQDEREANHMAVWTPEVACASDKQCGSDAACTGGACVPEAP